MKEKLPNYIHCYNKQILVCEYFLTERCQELCAYAQDVGAFCAREGMSSEDTTMLEGIEKLIDEAKE